MDLRDRKSRWKLYLGMGGLLIVLISVFFTNYLTNKLGEEERKRVDTYLFAQTKLADPATNDEDFTLYLNIINSNTTIPVILVNERGNAQEGRNFGESLDTNTVFLQEEVEELKAQGQVPIDGGAQSIYYKESRLLTLLRYFPFLQLILIGAFILFGYFGFSSARRAEQNRVWVGMAKETAHQLGTPISAILGWIEHLKMMREDDEETLEVVDELRNDVSRLELIAERFSKIGSAPTLEPINIYDELEVCRAYMQRRAPRKVKFDFPSTEKTPLMVNINPPLFDWVIENLLRNALDAMGGTGAIKAVVHTDGKEVVIEVSDTGKGIPASKFKKVFEPGFTTKKRGWGLGLSLAKRIIEEYHSGKIFVKKSVEQEGTTFSIRLPKS